MVVADRVGGNDADAGGKPGNYLRRKLFPERDQQRVLALAARHQLVRAHDAIGLVQLHIVVAPRALDHGRAQHARYQEFRLRHSRFPSMRNSLHQPR